METDPQVQRRSKRLTLPTFAQRISWADAAIVLVFLLLALMHQYGRFGGAYPFATTNGFVYLEGDAANIASLAAGWDHPELFRDDELLADRRNFRNYLTVHIPVIRGLTRISGEYGAAFSSLLWLHVFVQAMGFYVLGRVIFQSRFWALLLAIVTLMPISLNLSEYWGIFDNPEPRFSFQALLPYVLALALYWRLRPGRWPWLMAIAGTLMYVHPVSAPTWGFAIWLGLWAFQPPSWSLKKSLGYMLLLGVVFLLVASPFLLHYLLSHAHGTPQGAQYDQVYKIMKVRFAVGYLDLYLALYGFIYSWSGKAGFYWAWAVVGVVLVTLLRRGDRKIVFLVGLWTAGLLTVSLAIPWAEQTISRAYGWIPVELDLVRGIRYTIPLMLLFCLWPIAEIAKKLQRGNARKSPGKIVATIALCTIGGFLVALWTYRYQPREILHTLSCFRHGEVVCEWQDVKQRRPNVPAFVEALNAVRRETAPGSKILPTSYLYELQIRYYALRPVVYAWKDGGLLAYSNHAGLIKWYENYNEMEAINNKQDVKAKLEALLVVSRRLEAQYLLIDYADSHFASDPIIVNSLGASIVWSNASFELVRVGSP